MRQMFKRNLDPSLLFRRLGLVLILLFCAAVFLALSSVKKIRLDFGFHSLFEKSAGLPALHRYKKQYGEDINLIIVTLKTNGIFTASTVRQIEDLTRFIEKQPEVEKVTSLTRVDVIRAREDEIVVEPFIRGVPKDRGTLEALRREALSERVLRRFLVSDDAKVTAVVVELWGHLQRQNRLIGAIERWIDRERQKNRHDHIEYYLGGVNVIQREYERVATQDMVENGALIIAIVALLLVVLYRNPIGVVLPVLSSLVSLALVLGLMAATDEPITMISQLVPEIILILGVADGVYILSRYMEERRRHPAQQAFTETMRAMVVACFFTSFTTAVGFGSCVAADMYIIRRFGVYIAAGVMISFLTVILLLPSILSLAKSTIPVETGRSSTADRFLDAFLSWTAEVAIRHGGKIMGVAAVVIGISLVFSFRMKMQHRLLSEIGEDNPVAKANAIFENHLFGVLECDIRESSFWCSLLRYRI